MGEIAEMMLDGTMCQVCGEFMDIGGEPAGYPVTCAGCQPDGDEILDAVCREVITERTRECSEPDCHRKFKTHDACLQHWRAKHG